MEVSGVGRRQVTFPEKLLVGRTQSRSVDTLPLLLPDGRSSMEVLNFVVRLASAVTDFGALENLRNAYRTFNKRSTSALVRRVGQQSALETRYGLAHSPLPRRLCWHTATRQCPSNRLP